MKLEAIGKPFIYKWPGGDVRLEPGKPIDLPPDRAAKLLARASGRVRQVDPGEAVVIEPAHRPDGQPMTPIYWETGTGQILGPAVPEYLARDGETFWIVTKFEGQTRWINADRLRSRTAFEQQCKPQVIELIREVR